MIALYISFRLLLGVLLTVSHFGLWAAIRRRLKATRAELDPGSTKLECIHAEHARKVSDRRIVKYERRILGLYALRDRVTQLKGRSVPYVMGSVDASLVWLAGYLGHIQPVVESVRGWF